MTKLNKNDIDNINKLIEKRYISKNKHPEKDLWIYNYTQHAQFDWNWNKYTLMCRGLILDANYNIIARPFPKFFSLEQLEHFDNIQIPNESFKVYEKLDGSLGITYYIDGKWYMSTRGSFESEMAEMGTKMLQNGCESLDPKYTYLFEIIYPENKIVVDYGSEQKLVLLAVIKTETGEEYDIEHEMVCFETAKLYDGVKDYTKVRDMFDGNNREGFVIKFDNNFRLKIKYEEYQRLHKVICSLTKKNIWKLMALEQKSFKDIIVNIPDEFHNWVMVTCEDLHNKFKMILIEHSEKMSEIISNYHPKDKKTFAQIVNSSKFDSNINISILFAMYNNSEKLSKIIWQMIKPKGE